MSIEEKDKWIEQFALTAMASYAALKYDENCYAGWKTKEQYLPYEEAETLAKQAFEREYKNYTKRFM